MAGNLKGIAESAGAFVSDPKRGVGGQLALCWAHRGVHVKSKTQQCCSTGQAWNVGTKGSPCTAGQVMLLIKRVLPSCHNPLQPGQQGVGRAGFVRLD